MLPTHLMPTYELLQRAFPEGLAASDYRPLLKVLYPHMGHRGLAKVVGAFLGRSYEDVLNDVYAAAEEWDGSTADLGRVEAQLNAAGFERWQGESF